MKLTRHKRRCAVEPVLATLLMIAVAVAMSVIIFMWSQGFLSNTSGATGSQQNVQNQAAQSSIAIELSTSVIGASGSNAASTPKITVVIRNVGAVPVTLGSATIAGLSSNGGFRGSLLVASLSSSGSSNSVTATDGSWTYSLVVAGGGTQIAKGGSATLTLTQATPNATIPNTQVLSGDIINLKITTTVGTFASTQFSVP